MDVVDAVQAADRNLDRVWPDPLLPAESPLAMPEQSFTDLPAGPRTRDRINAVRATLLAMTFTAAAGFATLLYQALSVVQLTPLQGLFLVLCTLCFSWIALGAANAVIGFVALVRPASARAGAPLEPAPYQRTALLLPIHNEDTARIAATIEAIAAELVALDAEDRFDAFVLSDSSSEAIRSRELAAMKALRRELEGSICVYYRARTSNTGKKAGNIADWVRRFGGSYQSFVILDADSIMSGDVLVKLQAMLAGEPRAGLIQTVPRLVGGTTLFARLQQFAVAHYGPIVSAGFAAWQGRSGNYWGHNAIVRTHAFAGAASLPALPGKPPLGGHVQSHDFVEAALLRRAGWEVLLSPGLQGSYEGCPPTLPDLVVRDRRWAQGNLQHMRLVGARGLPWLSRMHLGMGIYAYLASPLWAASLVVGIALAIESAYTLPVYFPNFRTLFPVWPVIDPAKALYLFLATAGVLLLPKLLGLAVELIRPKEREQRGAAPLLAGALVEIAFSTLIAPIFMATQTRGVFEILTGRDSGWLAQRRAGERPTLASLARFHGAHVGIGLALLLLGAIVPLHVLAWMSPIVAGLGLSVVLSYVTALEAPDWLAEALATPEDVSPPAIVVAVEQSAIRWTERLTRSRDQQTSAG